MITYLLVLIITWIYLLDPPVLSGLHRSGKKMLLGIQFIMRKFHVEG